MKKTMQWSVDEYDENGKLIILYRFQRVLDHSIIKGGDLVLDVPSGKWRFLTPQEASRLLGNNEGVHVRPQP